MDFFFQFTAGFARGDEDLVLYQADAAVFLDGVLDGRLNHAVVRQIRK